MWQVPPRGPCWEVRDRLLNADEEETEGLSGAGGLRTDAWREAGITQVNGWVWGWQKGPWHLRALHCSLEESGRRKAQHCNSHYNDNHRSLQSLSTKKKVCFRKLWNVIYRCIGKGWLVIRQECWRGHTGRHLVKLVGRHSFPTLPVPSWKDFPDRCPWPLLPSIWCPWKQEMGLLSSASRYILSCVTCVPDVICFLSCG